MDIYIVATLPKVHFLPTKSKLPFINRLTWHTSTIAIVPGIFPDLKKFAI